MCVWTGVCACACVHTCSPSQTQVLLLEHRGTCQPIHQLTRHRQVASTPLDPESTPGSNTFMTETEQILHSVLQRHGDSVKPWQH